MNSPPTVWETLTASASAAAIRRKLASGEGAQAWLFTGPRGSGKRPTALALASAVNCPKQPDVGCGVCSTCSRIIRRRYPDVHHIVPEGPLIPVDVIREQVIPEAARSPFEGRIKVFVIEEAERMNPAAQNALLKTLEEPLADTIFVLISDRSDELLETVVSRCRVVHFEPIPEARVAELLERAGAEPESARLAARAASGDFEWAQNLAFDEVAADRRRTWLSVPPRLGSPVAALDVADEVVSEAKEAVAARELLQKEEVVELAEAMGEGRGTAAARTALAKRHKRELRRLEEMILGEALETLASFYRDVLAARRGAREAVVNIDLHERLEEWAASDVGSDALLAAVSRLAEVRSSLTKNANSVLAIEAVLAEVGRLTGVALMRTGV